MPGQRPRLLLVPALTELEWQIKPRLEEWADVATYDAPGVGDEPAAAVPGREATVARGLAELDRRDWEDGVVVVGDEWGVPSAVKLAASRPGAVAGLALGHAVLSYQAEGPRPTVNREVRAALGQLSRLEPRAFARHLTQMSLGAYDDDVVRRYLERVPREVVQRYFGAFERPDPEPIGETLRQLDAALLLVGHEGCLQFTDEGFEDAVAAYPEAQVARVRRKPSVSPGFAAALRDFCAELLR